jgi:Ni/Co efflux regulator RcnB
MTKITTALITAALALPVFAGTAMAAPGHGPANAHNPMDHGQMDHWNKGEKFDQRRASHYQVVDYRQHRGLKAPPRGYHYVRSGNDILLVGITSGVVASILGGAFH